MIYKLIILVMLIFILLSLSGGLFFLARDRGQSKRTVRALTIRVALSVGLFILLIIGFLTGHLQPHGIYDHSAGTEQGTNVNP